MAKIVRLKAKVKAPEAVTKQEEINEELFNNEIPGEDLVEDAPVEKKKKAAKPEEETPEDKLVTSMQDTLDNMKLSKRVFKKVPLDDSTDYIRHLVSFYYMMQDNRIKINNQSSSIERRKESEEDENLNDLDSVMMQFFTGQMEEVEENLKVFLDVWTDRHPIGKWLKSITGIGPVIAAGLIARFDVTKSQTAGGFWSYIGWASGGPNRKTRKRGQKLDYSPETRTLVWKAGSSFRMQNSRANCYYGKLYLQKKADYIAKNNAGGFAENAAYELSSKKFDMSTKTYQAYSSGKLTDAHIDAMALRYAAKIFVSHLFDVMFMWQYGEMPPKPYAMVHLNGHTHYLIPQNIELMIEPLTKKFPHVNWREAIVNHYHHSID